MGNKNISYKESIPELNEINERTKNIKEKIKKEIKKIENSQLEIFSEIISTSWIRRRRKIIKIWISFKSKRNYKWTREISKRIR